MTSKILNKTKQFLFLGLTFLISTVVASAGPLIIDDEAPFVPTLDTRIRYEYGDLDGRDSSHNFSIRNRLGLLTKEVRGFQFFAEYEGTHVADRNTYRAAGVHGPANRTVIADPISNELNQLWVSYKSADDTLDLKVGRQGINIGNQRYVGTVAWRQNMQTFDAATLKWWPNSDLAVSYSYVSKVNRIFGSRALDPGVPPQFSDFEGDSHFVDVTYKSFPLGKLTGYVYSMDLSTERGGLSAASNNSFGFHLTGDFFDTKASYYLEYGHQTDAHDSPLDYAANYGHAYVGFPIVENLKATVGVEYLGSDNGVGYQFPLATLHKFNGFADQFLNTPGTGLVDTYVALGTKLPCDIGATLFYHHFTDDDYDVEFGNEVDIVLSKKLNDRTSLLAKGAFFFGNDTGFNDLNRVTLQLDYKF